MNQKITLPKAARLIAESTGLGVRQCEDFLKGLAEIVTESLVAREQVKIKGLGTFRVTRVEGRNSIDVSSGEPNHIAEHTKVVFIPCREMAVQVNTPFEFFEAVEIDDSVAEKDLELNVSEENGVSGDLTEKEVADTLHFSSANIDQYEAAVPDMTSEEEDLEIAVKEKVAENATEASIVEPSADDDRRSKDNIMEDKEEYNRDHELGNSENDGELNEEHPCVEHHYKEPVHYRESRGHRFGWGFITGFGVCLAMIALGIGIGFVMMWTGTKEERAFFQSMIVEDLRLSDPEENSDITISKSHAEVAENGVAGSISEDIDPATSGEDVATAPSDKGGVKEETVGDKSGEDNSGKGKDAPVYDTISKTRFLTTMAKQHYGDFNLWPYIYEENKAILGHPDRIRPGTKVVIPPLSKYGVTGSAADIAKAKQLGAEIYARYK